MRNHFLSYINAAFKQHYLPDSMGRERSFTDKYGTA